MATKLSAATLAPISLTASVPHYNRTRLKAGIVHIGVGKFHRAHQAVYMDDLFNLGDAHDWAIIGAGVRAADGHTRLALEPQDWMSTVVSEDGHRSIARVLAPMIEFIEPSATDMLLDRLEDPAVRVVSMTVTEAGYYIDSATGHFKADHPDMVADAEDINAPKTAIGVVVSGLKRRWDAGSGPFTVLSCDDMPENGRIAESAVLDLAAMVDPELAGWIRSHVTFPGSIAERVIKPADDTLREMLDRTFGIEDAAPVFCTEPRRWIIEDDFAAGRPPLEKVGVAFVSDIREHQPTPPVAESAA